jgi:hypothetical protein
VSSVLCYSIKYRLRTAVRNRNELHLKLGPSYEVTVRTFTKLNKVINLIRQDEENGAPTSIKNFSEVSYVLMFQKGQVLNAVCVLL